MSESSLKKHSNEVRKIQLDREQEVRAKRREYREEKDSNRSFWISIISLIVSVAALLVAILR